MTFLPTTIRDELLRYLGDRTASNVAENGQGEHSTDTDTEWRCYACYGKAESVAEEFAVDDYRVVRCPHCASLETRPLPSKEELAAYYAAFNDDYTAGMGERYATEMPKRLRARINLLQRLQRSVGEPVGGRLLDVSGSNGLFGQMAHDSGYRLSVVDHIEEPRDLGFAVVQPADASVPGGIPYDDGTFDVVTMWSCIEHVLDPNAAMAELMRVVRPGGLVALDTPLVGDTCELAFPARSHWICPPEHLHLLSAEGLRMCVQRAGGRVIHQSPFHERNLVRWFARRARNVAVAGAGLGLLTGGKKLWDRRRQETITQAGDIQVLVAQR